MRISVASALLLVLAFPALADGPRPLPRPASVERLAAFAGATELAPRVAMRPRVAPAGPQAMPATIPDAAAFPDPLTRPDAAALLPEVAARRGAESVALLARPGLLPQPVPDPARLPGPTRSITLSTSGAVAPVFATAALAIPRPLRRPEATSPEQATPAAFAPAIPLRPRHRPETLKPETLTAVAMPAPQAPAAAVAALASANAFASPRPAPRPRGLFARAAARQAAPAAKAPAQPAPEQIVKTAATRVTPGKALVVPKKGAICGDPAIQGAMLAPITSRVQGCGIANPVRVTSVDGVRLSTPATLDCDTARALRQWVSSGLKPAAGKAGVAEIRVAAHYACRPRNNIKGARVSEHGRGKAIDIAGITLANGKSLSILGDYRRAEMLQKVRRAACGIFGTTLGPGSDRHHNDHFHFDTASHRNGPYCR